VQGALEDALARLLGQEVATTGAGRTDRGVHALAQVVHADIDTSVPAVRRFEDAPEVLRGRLDQLTGAAITIWRLRWTSQAFDARFSATERRYRYRLVDSDAVDPLRRHVVWHVAEPLAVGSMRAAGALLVGEHDFASFCRRAPGGSTVRRIDRLTVSRAPDRTVEVRLGGPAFCHQQVRSIVGCLAEVGRGRRPGAWVAEVLDARDRSAAARVAPPHGLVLERVAYGRRFPAAPPPTS
jgi:tRNA pseudouridine38-40 synthase